MEDDEDELTFKFDKNGVLKVEGNLAELVAKCEDSSGNPGMATAEPVFLPEDNEEEEEEEEEDEDD